MAGSSPQPPLWRAASTVVRQAVRLGRRLPLGPAVVVAIGAAFVAAGYVILAATSLSPAQQRDKEFGIFESFAGYGTAQLAPGDDQLAGNLRTAMRGTDADRFLVTLTAAEFYVTGLPQVEARFQEHSWTPNPFPRRYRLTRGAWPREPGEVALTATSPAALGQVLRPSGGRTRLTVVGIVQDDYAELPAILAAPGTWRSLDAQLAKRFITVRAQPTVYWSGGDGEVVVGSIERVLLEQHGDRTPDETRQTVRDSYQTAPSNDSPRRTPWLDSDRVPAGYAIPALLLPLLTALLAVAMAERRLRHLSRLNLALGLPHTILPGGYCLAIAASVVVAAPVGGLLGWRLVGLLQPVLEHVASRPVDLSVSVAAPLLRYTVLTGLTTLVASILMIRKVYGSPSSSGTTTPFTGQRPTCEGRDRRITWTEARRLVALLAFCAALLRFRELDSPGRVMIFSATLAVAVLLLLPDLMPLSLRLLPESGWRTRLVRRRLQAHRGAATATVTVLALVTGLTVGYLAVLDTWLASADAKRLPRAAPGEVLVVNRNSHLFPPPRSTGDVVEAALPQATHSIHLSWAVELDPDGNTEQAVHLPGATRMLLAVPDRDAIARILQRPLTSTESSVLDRSGVIVWSDGEVPGRPGDVRTTAMEVADADGTVRRTIERVPTVVSAPRPSAWQAATFGVVEQRTTDNYQLPLTSGAWLYSPLPDTAVQRLRRVVSAGGVDPGTVLTYEPPPPVIPAIALPGTAAILSLLLFALMASTTWTGAAALRQFTLLLACLGIPPTKAKTVVLIQHAYLFGTATLIGALLALPPVATTVLALPGYRLHLPWTQIAVLTGSLILAAGASTVLALVRLRASTATD